MSLRLDVIASVERHIDNAIVVDNLALSGLRRLEQRGVSGNVHHLGHRAEFQADIKYGCPVNLQDYSGAHRPFKAGGFHLNAVLPDAQRHRHVAPEAVRFHRVNRIGSDVRESDLRPRDDCSGIVGNRTGDPRRLHLPVGDG